MSSQAETTMKHFSHPHPLQLSNHQNSQLTSCSGCQSQATGMIYSCKTCNYFLHSSCAKMPQQITHPFDKGHVLTLHPKPPYEEGMCNYCDACGKPGQGFCYHCKICKIDLHILCAAMPLTFNHQSHPHQLNLLFSPTHLDKKFNCDVCNTLGSNHWLYRCDICDFDVHLNCKNVPVVQPVKQANMHQHQASFHAFPNQTPIPLAPQNVQQPGFAFSRSAPQVPPSQAPHFQPFNPPHAATGVPINQGIDPALVHFIQRLQAVSSAQNRLNQHHLQALLAGGGFGGGVGGFGGGSTGGLGGMQNLIQAVSGVGNGFGGNIPGLDLLGNGSGELNFLQGLLGGGGNGLNILGGDGGGLSLLNGLDLGGLLGGFSF